MVGSHRRFRSPFVIAAMTLLLGCSKTTSPIARQKSPPVPTGGLGSFFQLPLLGSGRLVDYVDSLAHEPAYTELDSLRQKNVETMFDAIMTARLPPNSWCMAVTAAGKAGYRLGRYYDTDKGRWFIVGADRSGAGQAYFFISLERRRDLVIEAPHVFTSTDKLEGRTDTEGAHLLLETMGWALLINGADRCQGGANICGGTLSSGQTCPPDKKGDPYHRSDMAHNTDSAFHVLHKKLDHISTKTRFVQLHGNDDSGLTYGGISVSDGRSDWQGSSGLATSFVKAISPLLTSSVNDCTSGQKILCGYENVQGRYTNDPDPNLSCAGHDMKKGGTRFLHLEQRSGTPPRMIPKIKSLIDDWQPVSDALKATFPCPGCSLPQQNFVPEQPGVCPEIP